MFTTKRKPTRNTHSHFVLGHFDETTIPDLPSSEGKKDQRVSAWHDHNHVYFSLEMILPCLTRNTMS